MKNMKRIKGALLCLILLSVCGCSKRMTVDEFKERLFQGNQVIYISMEELYERVGRPDSVLFDGREHTLSWNASGGGIIMISTTDRLDIIGEDAEFGLGLSNLRYISK